MFPRTKSCKTSRLEGDQNYDLVYTGGDEFCYRLQYFLHESIEIFAQFQHWNGFLNDSSGLHWTNHVTLSPDNSEFTQQDGRKRRTAKRVCVTNVTGLCVIIILALFYSKFYRIQEVVRRGDLEAYIERPPRHHNIIKKKGCEEVRPN